jgi:uncharacterized membrane protein YoaK (UPF0700 family)
MNDIGSGLIAVLLCVSMVLAIESGFRIGRRRKAKVSDAARNHVTNLQSSILGILALLLGFTFSLALQRFDGRSEAVVHEANAIGTTWLRAQLLPPAVRGSVQTTLRDYIDLRVREGHHTLADHAARRALMAQAGELQTTLWNEAQRAVDADPRPVTTGLFIQALNDMIDALGTRDAALARHVPEIVLMLLYATFLMTGAIVGYTAGVAGHRPSLVSYILVVLIVVLVFIILDLDRPRRGWIEVSQQPLVDLQQSIHATPPATGLPPTSR